MSAQRTAGRKTAMTYFPARVEIPVDPRLLATVDRWVTQGLYPSRSQALHAALQKAIDRYQLRQRARRYEGHVA